MKPINTVLLISMAVAIALCVLTTFSAGAADAQRSTVARHYELQDAEVSISAGKVRADGDISAGKVIELTDGVSIVTEHGEFLVESATWYPELKIFQATSLHVRPLWDTGAKAGTVTFTCSNGTLYRNGATVPGNTTCFNGASVSCSGNRVNLRYGGAC